MKSRLMSTAAALFLLLGLVSTGAFAQVSSASAVNFFIRTYNSDGAADDTTAAWHGTTAGATDTVGRKMDVVGQWVTSGQSLTSVSYTITFPKGTWLEASAADSVYLRFYKGQAFPTVIASGVPQEVEVNSANITVTANSGSTYSSSATPTLTVTDNTVLSDTVTTVQLVVLKGSYLGKVKNTINSTATGMAFKLNISSQATTTFIDSTGLTATNDLAAKAVFNTGITAYIDSSSAFPASDTIYFADRFGNKVPDYPAAGDYFDISVTSGAGKFLMYAVDTSSAGITPFTDGNVLYPTASDSSRVRVQALNTYPASTNDGLLYIRSGYRMVLLGQDMTSGVQNKGGVGLAFNGVNANDSTTFTIKLYGKVNVDAVLGVAPDSTASITRAREASDAAKQIGSISIGWTRGGDTYVGGLLNGTAVITIKNIFGEDFDNGTVIGTGTDPVKVAFCYVDSPNVVNATKTAIMASGGTVNNKSMPATTLNHILGSGNSVNDHISGSNIVGTIGASSAFTISAAAQNLPVYYGMASPDWKDSVGVVVYAANDASVSDTFFVKVQPGSPVTFDLTTLTTNLQAAVAAGQLVKNNAFPVELPMVALDTAYNAITNLDLTSATVYLEAIEMPNSGSIASGEHHGSYKVINFLLDGRDPTGYDATVRDSLQFSTLVYNSAGILAKDSSFVGYYNAARDDSSIINIGGVGDDSLGLRLMYTGINYVLAAEWDPAAMGSGWNPAARDLDIGLFSLIDTTAIDSAQSVTIASTTHRAGRTDTMIVQFVLPQGNTVGPNNADSLIFVKFTGFAGAAGLPVGLTKENVQVSLDSGANWYNALGVSSITSEEEDSLWLATPITLNAASAAKTVQVRFLNFVNPTKANVDSSGLYGLKVKTEATPVVATAAAANVTDKFVADTTASLLIVAVNDTLKDTYPRWTSDVVNLSTAVTVKADEYTMIKLLRVDQYGNIVNEQAGNTGGTVKALKITSLDSTAAGGSLTARQTWDNAVTNSTAGTNGIDYLRVKTDDVSAEGTYADSIQIMPEVTNGGVAYYIVIADSTNQAAKDSFLVSVYNTKAKTLTLDPSTNIAGGRGAALPAMSATLTDTLGNIVPDSLVKFGVYFGGTTGAITDTNGTAVTLASDTVEVATNASGVASIIYTTGQAMDTVAIKVWTASGTVAAKYFTATLSVVGDTTRFTVASPTDSLVPNLTTAGTITASVLDANNVSKVWANVWSSELTLDAENKFVASEATEYLELVDTTFATPTDSVLVSLVLPSGGDTVIVDTARVVKYVLAAVDANDDTTYSDTMMYTVAPKRGKRDMSDTKVNVADVMRLVYLIAIPDITPKLVDYFGLDLDQSGDFDTPDLTAELAIWKGTGTMLAGAASLENATAKTSISYEATDKASANLALNLESSTNLGMSVVRIKYDTDKFVFGEAVATDRLKNVTVVTGDNKAEGIFTIVMLNTEGGMILQGNGAILNIQVAAVGEKFDGAGDISLLSAGFEDGVAAELSREVLSPKALLPKAFALSQNYPNPFNPSTTIAYDIPEGDNVQVQLNVYNMRGQLVRTLVNDAQSEGSYQIQWDGSDNYGRRVASGVYFYRIKAGEFSKTRKMVILK